MSGEVVGMGPESEPWLSLFQQQQDTMKSGAASPGPLRFPTSFPYDFLSSDYSCSSSSSSSNPGSPVESATESEGQSDDDLDEYLAGLTTQMAHSFLQEADDDTAADPKLSWSPPSPVCTSGAGPLLEAAFLKERETCKPPSTRRLSPPEAPTKKGTTALDALYAAADQGARLKQQQVYMGSVVFGGLSFPVVLPHASEGRGLTISDGYAGLGNYCSHYGKPVLNQHQLQVAQLKHQQLVNQQLAAAAAWRRRNGGSAAAGSGHIHPLGLPSSSWPSLQPPPLGVGKPQHGVGLTPPPPSPQSGSGMRAVFLPGGLGQKPSTGTGVFLPRRAGPPTKMHRKTACSTVLVPARVVHALNSLNLEAAAAAAAAAEAPAAGHRDGVAAGGLAPWRPPQVYGPACGPGGSFGVRHGDADGGSGGATVASYSSLVDSGGGDNANNNKKNSSSCGCEQFRLGLGVGRRLPPQEEQQRRQLKQQQQQPPPLGSPTGCLSPETRLPSEWIY